MIRNILIINDYAHINGGAGKVALMSAKALSNRNYRVIVFTAVAPIDKSLEGAGVEIICTGQNDILHEKNKLKAAVQGIWNMKAYKVFRKILTTLNPHETIIHFHSWNKALSISILYAATRSHIPIAITIHDYFLFCPNGGIYEYPTRKICEKKPYSCACYFNNCDSRNYVQKLWRSVRGIIQKKIVLDRMHKNIFFISIGETNHHLAYKYLNSYAKKLYNIQNPIELNRHEPVDICSNNKYLFIGRLSPEKGVYLFCQALTDLGLSGIVLGDGRIKDNLRKRYPNIEFAGWLTGSDMEGKIREGKALLFPSLWYEGAPLTIPEIMSYGIPCIVPDKCAASELVDDGKTGYVFKIGDINSLKETILRYEQTNVGNMQQNIKKTFHFDNFSMDSHIRTLIAAYNDMVQLQ